MDQMKLKNQKKTYFEKSYHEQLKEKLYAIRELNATVVEKAKIYTDVIVTNGKIQKNNSNQQLLYSCRIHNCTNFFNIARYINIPALNPVKKKVKYCLHNYGQKQKRTPTGCPRENYSTKFYYILHFYVHLVYD